MSWAAQRHTTRIEDAAYSLLGLFDVNMPMIYGEGPKAFIRLQFEILKTSNDQSLFAWLASSHDPDQRKVRGPFAESPYEFAQCGDISCYHDADASEYSLTNRGLRIAPRLLPCVPEDMQEASLRDDLVIALLNCSRGSSSTRIGIHLKRIRPQANDFVRTRVSEFYTDSDPHHSSKKVEIYITTPDKATLDSYRPRPGKKYKFTVTFTRTECGDISCVAAKTYDEVACWYDDFMLRLNRSGTCGGLLFKHSQSGEAFAVVLGIHKGIVWSDVETNIGDQETLRDILLGYQEQDPFSVDSPREKRYAAVLPCYGTLRNQRRYDTVLNSLDRVTQTFGGDMVLRIVLKPTINWSSENYMTKITVSPRENWKGSGQHYRYMERILAHKTIP